jgi:hypothetical protein
MSRDLSREQDLRTVLYFAQHCTNSTEKEAQHNTSLTLILVTDSPFQHGPPLRHEALSKPAQKHLTFQIKARESDRNLRLWSIGTRPHIQSAQMSHMKPQDLRISERIEQINLSEVVP